MHMHWTQSLCLFRVPRQPAHLCLLGFTSPPTQSPSIPQLRPSPMRPASWANTNALHNTTVSVGALAPDGGDPRPLGNWADTPHLASPLAELCGDKVPPCILSGGSSRCQGNTSVEWPVVSLWSLSWNHCRHGDSSQSIALCFSLYFFFLFLIV